MVKHIGLFFTLSELAERWDRTEKGLLHAAAAGILPLSFWYDGPVRSRQLKAYGDFGGYGRIDPWAIYGALVHGYSSVHVTTLTVDSLTVRKELGDDPSYVDFENYLNDGGLLGVIPTDTLLLERDPLGPDKGKPRLPRPCPDLLQDCVVLAEDVARLEKERPAALFGDAIETRQDNEHPPTPSHIPAQIGRVLTGWLAIAKHLDCSVSTAKRRAKGCHWPQTGPTGKPTTTTAELDAWQLSPQKKKKSRGAK